MILIDKKIDGLDVYDIAFSKQETAYKKVVKPEYLLNTISSDMTILQYRIISFILAKTKEERFSIPFRSNCHYLFDLKNLITKVGTKRSGSAEKRYKKEARNLLGFRIDINREYDHVFGSESVNHLSLFSSVRVSDKNTIVSFMLSEPFANLLNTVKAKPETQLDQEAEKGVRYSMIDLDVYLKASRVGSMKLVELCQEFIGYNVDRPYKDFEINNLKAILVGYKTTRAEQYIEKYKSSQFVTDCLPLFIDEINEKNLLGQFEISFKRIYDAKKENKIASIRIMLEKITTAKPLVKNIPEKPNDSPYIEDDKTWVDSLTPPPAINDEDYNKSLVSAHKKSTKKRKPAPKNGTPAPENGTPAPENGTPAPENGTPAPENGTPAPENGTPAPENGTPAPENGTPAPESPVELVERLMRESLARMAV